MIKLNAKYKLVILAALLLLGCQKEEIAPNKLIGDSIIFSLNSIAGNGQGYSASTKTAESTMVLKSEDGTDSLIINLASITETEEITDTATTKGSPVTDNNIINVCAGNIALRAFYNDEQFVDDILIFENDGSARTSNASYWPSAEDAMVDFWSYHPKGIDQNQHFSISNSTDSPSLSFYYTLRKGEENILVDATEQKDLFLAYTRQGKESGTVNLKYIHALSAIKFSAGKALAGEIQNITISNVYAGGRLVYTPNETDKLKWELDNEKFTLNQDFTKDIIEDLSGSLIQGITLDNTTFMLIPQPLTDKVLTIKYLREGDVEATTYTANIPEGNWETGKSYTYTLTLMDGLGFEIETSDQPSSNNMIDGVKIKNTYNKPCYIRAMIIGNWVDEDGNVAAIFNPDEINLKISQGNSNYQLSADWEDHWFYDEDTNIYYYKKVLRKTESTPYLFEKFTSPTQHSEALKMDFAVLVQAVEAENNKASLKAAWGETIANILE